MVSLNCCLVSASLQDLSSVWKLDEQDAEVPAVACILLSLRSSMGSINCSSATAARLDPNVFLFVQAEGKAEGMETSSTIEEQLSAKRFLNVIWRVSLNSNVLQKVGVRRVYYSRLKSSFFLGYGIMSGMEVLQNLHGKVVVLDESGDVS